MKKHRWLALFLAGILIGAVPSSFADWRYFKATNATPADGKGKAPDDPKTKTHTPEDRRRAAPHAGSPFVGDGQIDSVSRDGTTFVFTLIRQKVRIVAWPSTLVTEPSGDRIHVAMLTPQDVIHVSGAIDGDVVYANRIVRQLHIAHIP